MYEEPEKVTKLRYKIEKALGKERKENRRENIIVRGGYFCCPECEQPIFSAYYEQETYAFCVGYLEFMHWDFSGKPDAVHNDTDMAVGEPIEDGMLYYCAEKECNPHYETASPFNVPHWIMTDIIIYNNTKRESEEKS